MFKKIFEKLFKWNRQRYWFCAFKADGIYGCRVIRCSGNPVEVANYLHDQIESDIGTQIAIITLTIIR